MEGRGNVGSSPTAESKSASGQQLATHAQRRLLFAHFLVNKIPTFVTIHVRGMFLTMVGFRFGGYIKSRPESSS